MKLCRNLHEAGHRPLADPCVVGVEGESRLSEMGSSGRVILEKGCICSGEKRNEMLMLLY